MNELAKPRWTGELVRQFDPFNNGKMKWAVKLRMPAGGGASSDRDILFWLGNPNEVPQELLIPGTEIRVRAEPQDQFAYYES
jgi:hypothetical protein